ncbi:MAG: KH domain-containing protein [Candidatus Paceibacterota bacterium]
MERDQEFLSYIVKTLVDHPESVTIERQVDEMGVLLRLRVHPEDMGQIVGRQGATAKAIRTLLRIVGIKANARVNLKIEEPEGSTRSTESAPAASAPSMEDKVASDMDAIADELKL